VDVTSRCGASRSPATYVLPALRAALRADPSLYILASPCPPGWMKSNGTMVGGGTLRPSAYRPLARYIVRFIEAYAAAGIPIAAVTPQNEPDARTAYPSMSLPEPNEARLIARDLQPELRRAGLGVGVFGVDSSWVLAAYASSLAASGAGGDLAGIAWHCYVGNPDVMSAFHRQHPGLEQIVDECSPEIRPFSTSEFEIASLRNWASVVSVWNLALDPRGGPVQQPDSGCSGCNGVVTVDPISRTFRPGLKYFELGQVSRFIQRGARRIASNHFVSYGLRGGQMAPTAGLDDVAFQNPDGTIVLVANNTSASAIRFAVESAGRFFAYRLPAGATATLRWR
jgi:glucosylceramidase